MPELFLFVVTLLGKFTFGSFITGVKFCNIHSKGVHPVPATNSRVALKQEEPLGKSP